MNVDLLLSDIVEYYRRQRHIDHACAATAAVYRAVTGLWGAFLVEEAEGWLH